MEKNFLEALKTSTINSKIKSNENYHCKLLSNNDEKIVSVLRKHFETCDEFIISVAFVTQGGLSLFLEQLKTLEEKNIKGKILTGDYLTFTEPKALKKLLSYKNIDLKIASHKKFHPKAYFFRKNNIWTLIVGSSNLTQSALTVNFEWNLSINSFEEGQIFKESLEKFNEHFDDLKSLTLKDIEIYQKFYDKQKEFYKNFNLNEQINNEKIKPNPMQENALSSLRYFRENFNRALVISATGTGKTFLSAFDVKNSKAKKVLFIAHRKIILEKSMASFKKIMPEKSMGIFDKKGETAFASLTVSHSRGGFAPNPPIKEVNCSQIFEKNCDDNKDITFAMIQTLSKKENLEKFSKDFFDYIIIDEVHHGGAKSYQNIFEYFEPKFLLGLTATPERTDNFDIYKLFNYNIAYEIRLHEAMKEELLCPFHYFGISDILIDGESINEKSSIKNLTSDERVRHILEKSSYYSYSGKILHCLVFVSKVEEAEILCEKFLERGIKSAYLSSKHSDTEREKTIEDFENGEINYLFTVDIFNEGIDIPCVNQVILLRPTQSSIVYIQQLGRGLRKNRNKDFTIILDFIGNYSKNFLIPIAISQNSNYDKDFMKRFLMNSTDFLAGESSVVFDKISKERIFENINSTNFSNRKLIEENFRFLEKQLGRFPLLTDFFEKDLLSPNVILKYKKNYDEILKIFVDTKQRGDLRPSDCSPLSWGQSPQTQKKGKISSEFLRRSLKVKSPLRHIEYKKIGELNETERNFLNFISSFFTPAKRIHEIFILKNLILKSSLSFEEIKNLMALCDLSVYSQSSGGKAPQSLIKIENSGKDNGQRQLNFRNNSNSDINIENALRHLTKEIFVNLSQIKPFRALAYKKENSYFIDEEFKKSYEQNSYFKLLIDDLISYNLKYCLKNYSSKNSEENLILFREYSKQEAFWYSNLDFNNGYQVSGYTAFEKEKILMIFITLDGSSSRNIYTNEFYDRQTFSWFSKSSRYLSKNNKLTVEGKIANNFYTIKTFIKKINGENFYYVGEVQEVISAEVSKDIKGKANVKYIFKLKNEIKNELFEYFNK
ncbi:MAG: DEAD/DEAH box helicase [Fusobacterium sp.]|nr:DEAD/DEAH box helicase [Fusobacterium sp.]